MAKIILWIVVVFAVLFVLRMINVSKSRRERDARRTTAANHPMVRCSVCGVYVPRADAKNGPAGLTCGDPLCLSR